MSNKILTLIGIIILVITAIVVIQNITKLSLAQHTYQNMTESQQHSDDSNHQINK